MTPTAIRITGTVVNAATRLGIPNLRVEAWDADLLCDDLVGSDVTDARGAFELRFTSGYFGELFLDRRPDLYFKVFAGDRLLADTSGAVRWHAYSPTRVEIVLPADAVPEPPPAGLEEENRRFVVRGHITDAAGRGRAELRVAALDRGTDRESPLGAARTDVSGAYHISYTSAQLSSPGKRSADLLVRVYRDEADAEPIAAAPLILHAYDNETVNLLVDDAPYRGPSEFDRVADALEPALAGVDLEAVDARGVASLAARTGVDDLHAAYYLKARREAVRADVPAAALYGLYRMRLPTSLPGLVSHDAPVLARAVRSAADANIIGREAAEEADAAVGALVAFAADVVARTDAPETRPIRDVLGLAGLKEDAQRRFLEAYAANEAPLPEFWSAMAGELGAAETGRLQTTLQLTALTLGNPALVRVLQESGDVRSPRELARLDAEGWLGVIRSGQVPVPQGVAGDTRQEREAGYATLLTRSVEAALPTAVLAHRWSRAEADSPVAAFLEANPSFEFGAERLTSYLARNPDAIADAGDPEATTRELLAVERLYRIAPRHDRFEHLHPLHRDGVRSAYAVKSMGRGAFMRAYATSRTEATYGQMYAEAVRVTDVALNAYFKYGPALNDIPLYVMPEYLGSGEGDPDLEALFGAQDYCGCEDCVSVLGPSAYLTDLLAFLDGAGAGDGDTGLEKLFERRPDLGNIDLTCENSHTPMPYIDLVNEVLENAVQPRVYTNQTVGGTTLRISDEVPQTEADAAELKANPEHLNPEAYETLAASGTVYPWSLPFSLWREEAARYLAHLGQPRHELIELFRPDAPLARAAEYLGLLNPDDAALADEVALLTTSTSSTSLLRSYWGVTSLNQLDVVLDFAHRAGMKYADVRELLKTRFVNGDGSLRVAFSADAPCSLADARIEGLTNSHLDRIHRFVRLQRRLGWAPLELDRALTALQAGEVTTDTVERLANVRRLRERFRKLAPETLPSWWAPTLDVARYEDEASLYEKLFLNKAVHNQPEEIQAIFGLNAAATELADATRSLTDPAFTALVLAAVRMTEEDLLLLIEEELGGSGAMTLASLSHLYRISSFARALRLKVPEYLSLRTLSGIRALATPGATAHPADTVRFVELVDELRGARVSIDELDYVLRHAFPTTSAVPPQDTETALLLEEIRTALRQIEADHAPGEGEELRAVLENRLSLVLEDDPGTATPAYAREEKVHLALAIVDRASAQDTAAQEAFIDADFAAFLPDLTDAKATLLAALPADPAAAAAELAVRYAYVLDPLVAYLIPRFMDEYLVQKLAAEVGLEAGITSDLLKTYLAHPSDPTLHAMDFFKSDAFLDSTAPVVDAAPFADGFVVAERLYKIARVVGQLGIPSADMAFLFGTGTTPAVGWLDLAALPLAEEDGAAAEARFAAWYKLFRTYGLQKKRFGEAYSVAALVALTNDPAVGRDAVKADLVAQTGWSAAEVDTLTGPGGFDVRFASDGGIDTDEGWLLKLDAAFDAIKRTGVSAAQLIGWTTDTVTYEQARAIKNAAKARYDNDEWLKVAGELRDVLRERQRDALQAYVLFHEDFEDADEMYAYYLIDTQMSACMTTSRIRQAISSVQLFVQRILMNLEADQIELLQEDAEEWAWRKTYRVWEANRKVFLYPENWIEPELRDDKTPFFRELENELLQNEVTDANVEGAYLNYLRRLDEVANLDVRAHHYDEEEDVTHVFARTRGQPHRHFYRQWRGEEGCWTPWEKLELDIEGDHLIPFIYNRRLYLAWVKLTERAVEEDPGEQDDAETPQRYHEVQLGWSEYRNGAWGPSNLTEDKLVTRFEAGMEFLAPPALLQFIPVHDASANRITIDCYETGFNFWYGRFRLSGCHEAFRATQPAAATYSGYAFLSAPVGAWWEYTYTAANGARPLQMEVTEKGKTTGGRVATILEEERDFRVVIPANQAKSYHAQAPFFYTAVRRTFFVLPEDAYRWAPGKVTWQEPEFVDPGRLDEWVHEYIPIEDLVTDPGLVDPEIGWTDPVPDWFADPVRGDIVFNGSTGGGLVIDRRDAALVGTLNGPAPAVTTPVQLMRETAGALRGGSIPVGDEADVSARSLAMRSRAALATASGGLSSPAYDGGSLGAGRAAATSAYGAASSGVLGTRKWQMEEVGSILTGTAAFTWSGLKKVWDGKRFVFRPFYQPYTCRLIKHLNQYGLDGILAPDARNGTEAASLLRQKARNATFFAPSYDPTALVRTPYPVEDFDFTFGGAYSAYNWELFFHAPLLIAVRLMQDQKFEEAQRWFHYVFNPTEVEGPVPERFWKFKPFHGFDGESNIAELMLLLNEGDDEMEKQVAAWEADPFDPHAIARLRTVAYMRAVVMKYIDNLIAWGDHLFRQDTMETINEATQLYVLAAQILGRRPEQVEGEEAEPRTFNQIFPVLDAFSNALVDVESAITVSGAAPTYTVGPGSPGSTGSGTLNSILYFCIPGNTHLLRYWDTVADRLFKIRNCMNIEGVRRQLALYEPPIDPGMLVRAAAAGVDLSSALGDLFSPLPTYRFSFMVAKAAELARDVQLLGAALLAALERKDAEELALLRAGHERELLAAVEEIRRRAIEEAELTRKGLAKAKEQADVRERFYSQREFISGGETAQLVLQGLTFIPEALALIAHLGAAGANLIPTFSIGIAGFGGSPNVSASFGGSNVAGFAGSAAAAASTVTGMLNTAASMVGTLASYDRRQEDWDHQAEIAAVESRQVQYQIEAADVSIRMAEKELENHQLQMDHAGAVYDFLRTRYTSKDLYAWMTTQVATLYFQSYQLAYETAKRAERTFRHELGVYDTSFIQFGYWDSLKKGLLAGERLLKDIRRMEMAYVEQHKREYELTKHISLASLNPQALLDLREHGTCEFAVPEIVFDLDYPGHYLRRIKSVSLTIPCVAGPYTTVSARLTLLGNRVRVDATATGSYTYEGITDTRFLHNLVGIQSISTSSAQLDSGLFELSFRDERYLPFEGAGAISAWRLELPDDFRQFDYDSISDAILHLSYTAREGGDALKAEVRDDVQDSLNRLLDILAETDTGMLRLLSMRHEFPDAFHQMLHPAAGDSQRTTVELGIQHFPYMLHDRELELLSTGSVTVFVKQREDTALDTSGLNLTVRSAGSTGAWTGDRNLFANTYTIGGSPLGTWELNAGVDGLDVAAVEDVYLLLRYTVTA